MMAGSFLTLAAPAAAQIKVRGSGFIAYAAAAASDDEARAVLAERRRIHFDATHNCSAWLLRDGTRRAHDDGEPSGSAGAPILTAIEAARLTDCVVVVTRYFGGTKLGVGGLVRAYGEAAARVLASAPRLRGEPAVRLRVCYAYGHTAGVMRVLERAETYEVEHGVADGGARGELRFSLPLALEAEVRRQLLEASAGEVEAERLEDRVVFRPLAG